MEGVLRQALLRCLVQGLPCGGFVTSGGHGARKCSTRRESVGTGLRRHSDNTQHLHSRYSRSAGSSP